MAPTFCRKSSVPWKAMRSSPRRKSTPGGREVKQVPRSVSAVCVAGDLLVLAAGGLDDGVEVAFEALAAFDLRAVAAVLLEAAELGEEILAAADQGAAGAVGGAAAFQDAPGGPFADAERLLEGAAVDQVGRRAPRARRCRGRGGGRKGGRPA